MNAVEMLVEHALRRGDEFALQDDRDAIGFADLDEITSRMATMFRDAGLRGGDSGQMGDVVLIMQPVSITIYVVLIAVLRARLTAMFVDPSAGRKAVVDACLVVPPRAMVGSTRACLYRMTSSSLRRIPLAFTTGSMGGIARRMRDLGQHAPLAGEPCPDETPALITFTSGSTGVPKVAVRTHGFLLAQHRALAHAVGLRESDEIATTFPVFVLSHLATGAATWLAAEPSLQSMGPSGITVIAAAPAWCEQLAGSCRREHAHLPSLRRIITGGGPVFPSLLASLREMAPQATITTLYGSTEAEPIAHIDYDQVAAEDWRDMRAGRGLLAGLPVNGIDLRILPDDFRAVRTTRAEFDAACLPANAAGEIVVSGAHVLPGYYHGVRDEETKLRVDDVVWHRTGDAGFIDDIRRVWLLGRVAARLRDAKGDLYPFQVEAVAVEEPGVRRSALLAKDGKRVLLVELRAGADADTVARLQSSLAWAHLDTIEVCDRIPTDRRHHSKVDYPALQKLLRR